jgi:hypothetical protein
MNKYTLGCGFLGTRNPVDGDLLYRESPYFWAVCVDRVSISVDNGGII